MARPQNLGAPSSLGSSIKLTNNGLGNEGAAQ